MKKFIVIFMLLDILVLSTGCTSSNNTVSFDEQQLYIIPSESDSYSIVEAPEVAFIDENTELPSSCPIYINQYAYGQEGALYEINDEVTGIMKNNLSQFLVLLYGETEAKDCDIVKNPVVAHKVFYDNGKSEMCSSVKGISIITNEYDNVTSADLNDNALLKTAVEYLNIQTPQIMSTIKYGTDGNPYEYKYKITEDTNDLFTNILNNSFSYITVTYSTDSEDVLLQICKVDMPDKYGDYKIISYDDVLKYLQNKYLNIDTRNIKAEIYYSATIQIGYYIPCYRFYLGKVSANGKNKYRVVDIPMTATILEDNYEISSEAQLDQ